MKVVESLSAWQGVRSGFGSPTVGFVPTMGALHAGHASLIRRARDENDICVLSIYVNPTQFDNPEDLKNYPSTLAEDLEIAEDLGVDYVLMPSYDELYPDSFRYQVIETEFSRELCGEHRDGHFTGVLTVVMKLLNLVSPTHAYFGEKDYQQLHLIKEMCTAFFLPVAIVPCPTIREEDGLAMSSRNKRLSVEARAKAPLLHQLIRSKKCDEQVILELTQHGFIVDYIVTKHGRRFAAAELVCGDHSVRLIDNVAMCVQRVRMPTTEQVTAQAN